MTRRKKGTPEERALSVAEQATRELKATRICVEKLKRYQNKFIVEAEKRTRQCLETLLKQEKQLLTLLLTNESAEQTLLNVLLAIRQNEYLQAWYPSQAGCAEQKVTGLHPLQTLRNK